MKEAPGLRCEYVLKFYIMAQAAEPGPPLGTVLGNLGVNAVKFAKDFNAYTEHLPTYFQLKVTVLVYDNRSFSFQTALASTSY